MSVRVLLADDHEIVLNGLRALLEKQKGIEVVGEAPDGHEAMRLTRLTRPDVVVMDVSMPGLNGIEATRRIAREMPDVKVLCLSMHSEERFVTHAFRAGAAGYLLKDCALEELVTAIRNLVAQRMYVGRGVAETVIEAFRSGDSSRGGSSYDRLTDVEREVLQLIAEGGTTAQIAEKLDTTPDSIEIHRRRIMESLEIDTIAGLTRYAIREGLTST